MAGLLQLGQNTIEQLEFARGTINIRTVYNAARVAQMYGQLFLDVLENERMIADLSQLHDRVHQCFSSVLARFVLGQNHATLLHLVEKIIFLLKIILFMCRICSKRC